MMWPTKHANECEWDLAEHLPLSAKGAISFGAWGIASELIVRKTRALKARLTARNGIQSQAQLKRAFSAGEFL